MRSIPRALIEKALMLTLIVSVALPLFLAALLRLWHDDSPRTAWLRNASLSGTPYQPESVPLTRATLLSSKYQTALAHDYDHTYAARELVIRLINELYLRLFKTSGGVVIGRHSTLYDQGYLDEYCLKRTGPDTLAPQAADLRRLQDFCEARGIAFALMITPSKAAVYPEKNPPSYGRRFRPGLRYYDSFLPWLKKAGIHFVDGHEIAMALKPGVELPLYPLGGIHWADQAALATGNGLLALLAKQGLPVKPITHYTSRVTNHPKDGRDRDLADFLNAVTRFDYPVLEITPEPEPGPLLHRPNIVFVGGSFDWKIMTLFDESRQFSEIDFFDYYTSAKHLEIDDKVYQLARPTRPVDFQTEIFAADALVLEVNEQVVDPNNHVGRFLNDALKALPDPHSPRARYKYEGLENYRWGDTLSFVRGKNPVKYTTGMAPPSETGAYTEGPKASLRIAVPPVTEDMEFRVTAVPILSEPLLPEQRAKVYVNDSLVGDMVWRDSGPSTRKLLVKKELLAGGRVHLEFRFAHLLSPAELGWSRDNRQLGICVSAMQFVPVSTLTEPTEQCLPYRWGETISFRKGNHPIAPEFTSGFTDRADQGSYTVGPIATIRLSAPPASGDLILSIEAQALLVAPRLPRQEVDVLINGYRIGRWEWEPGTPPLHQLTVPKDLMRGGETELQFQIRYPTSPADLGLGNDPRKVGIVVSRIRLQEPDQWP